MIAEIANRAGAAAKADDVRPAPKHSLGHGKISLRGLLPRSNGVGAEPHGLPHILDKLREL